MFINQKGNVKRRKEKFQSTIWNKMDKMLEKLLTESEKHSHVKCSLQILHLISGVSFNNEIVISSMFPNLWGHEEFRYMKIHIFALRWRDEIRRSSQLRTLLKLVVVNRTWKKIQNWVQIPYGQKFFSGPIYNY